MTHDDMPSFHLDVTSAGEADLRAALLIAFRGGSRRATHVLESGMMGLVLFDFTTPGTSVLPGIVKLPEALDVDGAVALGLEWLSRDDGTRSEKGDCFRVFCARGGDVWNEPHAFVAVKHAPLGR